MKTKLLPPLFLAAFTVLSLHTSPAAALSCPDGASINGKYNTCIGVLPCAKDESKYGPKTDFGLYGPARECGQSTPSPRGYWVYFGTTWYIWQCTKYVCQE